MRTTRDPQDPSGVVYSMTAVGGVQKLIDDTSFRELKVPGGDVAMAILRDVLDDYSAYWARDVFALMVLPAMECGRKITAKDVIEFERGLGDLPRTW
jgi:hypothetical protein